MSGDPMGKQDESGPVMDYDKSMSKRHKAHRREVDMIKDMKTKLTKSILYNALHRDEHKKALKESQKRLKKLR